MSGASSGGVGPGGGGGPGGGNPGGGGGPGGGSQRKYSVGRLPEAPQWNVQVVKVNTRCFWNACKALSFGLGLMLIGTTMATLGYYADQLSVGQEMRGNTTVRIKHETRGFHLNNLSYAGPIVMGVGGFIVVAACVMTFEARDSAAKVVPARNKYAGGVVGPGGVQGTRVGPQGTRMHSSVRSGPGSNRNSWQSKWEQQGGSVSGAAAVAAAAAAGLRTSSPCPSESRRALTAAFVQFSRTLQYSSQVQPSGSPALSKSPSAPNLAADSGASPALSVRLDRISPRSVSKRSRNSLHPMIVGLPGPPPTAFPPIPGCALLNPHALLYRQALSMDNPEYTGYFSPPRMSREPSGKDSRESVNDSEAMGAAAMMGSAVNKGSQASMVMDLHVDCPVTLRVKDKTRRSDTAKRHVFTRQTPVLDDEENWERRETHSCSPRLPGYHQGGVGRCHLGEGEPLQTRSTPHSRRESVAGSSRRGSATPSANEEATPTRSRANTAESLVRVASVRRPRRLSTESRRRMSTYSRSASDRSTQPPTPHESCPEPHLLAVPMSAEDVIVEMVPEQS